MLTRIDRLQVAVPDRSVAARAWVDVLGAEHDGEGRVAALGAHRSRYRLGDGWVELLEPDGAGLVADAVARRGAHLFAGGAATADLAAVVARVRERGGTPAVEGGQAFLAPDDTGGHGLRLVVSEEAPDGIPGRVGGADTFYEVTNLVADAGQQTKAYAGLLGLDATAFVPIESSHYGYAGTLTLFDPDRLDRLEVITPSDPSNTMGRYFARQGESLYMAFAESGDLSGIVGRAAEADLGCTAEGDTGDGRGPHTVFLHPGAELGGMMLGVSRRGFAWTWSGDPERARRGETGA